MNDAHLHLIVNHLPIIFPIAGLIIMLVGMISKSDAVKRAALMLFIIGALASLAAMNTGEGAEEVVEGINGVSENYIEAHEEIAEVFAVLAYILGALSIASLWASFKHKSFQSLLVMGTSLFAVVVIYFAQQTGTTGGEIRHTEIRSGAAPAMESEEGH